MRVEIKQHPDGTYLITYHAETAADFVANKLLLQRYNDIPVVDGESFIGSWSSDGSCLTLKVFQFTPEELERQAAADAMISVLNGTPKNTLPLVLTDSGTDAGPAIRNFNELLRIGAEVIVSLPGEHYLKLDNTFTCHSEGNKSVRLRVIVTSIEQPNNGRTRMIIKQHAHQP
jgi:hypothetical protein